MVNAGGYICHRHCHSGRNEESLWITWFAWKVDN